MLRGVFWPVFPGGVPQASRGPLNEDGLSKVEECCELQGTGALIMLLPALPVVEPGQEEQDVPVLSALLQLKQLQQASAWHSPLPLVILVPGSDSDTKQLEEGKDEQELWGYLIRHTLSWTNLEESVFFELFSSCCLLSHRPEATYTRQGRLHIRILLPVHTRDHQWPAGFHTGNTHVHALKVTRNVKEWRCCVHGSVNQQEIIVLKYFDDHFCQHVYLKESRSLKTIVSVVMGTQPYPVFS